MAHRNWNRWGSYLPFGAGFLKFRSNFHHSNGGELSWRLAVVKGEREWRIEGLLGFLSHPHEVERKPVHLEEVCEREAVTQRLGTYVP